MRRPGKTQRADLAHLHFHHRGPRHRQRFSHHRLEIIRPIDAPRLQTDGLRQQRKVRRMQLVIILAAAKVLILNTAHHAVAAVIHNQQRHVSLLLCQRRQLAEVQAQSAVADQPHHFTLRISNCGADRHRQPHTDSTGQRMNIHQRTVGAKQAAPPQAAGHGNIANQDTVLRQRLRDSVI